MHSHLDKVNNFTDEGLGCPESTWLGGGFGRTGSTKPVSVPGRGGLSRRLGRSVDEGELLFVFS